MKKVNLNKYARGCIQIQIQSLFPERFINLLWNNNVNIKNICKINITTMNMEINLKDYNKIEGIAKKTNTSITIIGRKGISFLILRTRRHMTLFGGIIIFIILLYYYSSFIWGIDIVAGQNVSPYEIRKKLFTYGIKSGISKKNINVYALQEKMLKDIDDIMWTRVRIEGSRLKVSVIERIPPPVIINDNEPCNMIASMDGQISRIFTTSGTAVVRAGDVVKKGQVLIKGEQGKEGSTYPVHSKGEVIAKTFYEDIREIQIKGFKDERTGEKAENLYLYLFGKKIYLKKTLNKFESYDKIEDNSKLIKREIYHETKRKEFMLNKEEVMKDTIESMSTKIISNLDKSVKLLDKVIESEPQDDKLRIRVLFIVEQNIAMESKIQ